MTIAERMIPELKAEAEMTRRLLARIPADKLDFSPGAGLNTVRWNAAHLAEIVAYVPGTLSGDGIDIGYEGGDPTVTLTKEKTIDVPAILAAFDRNLADALASLAGVSDATMAGPWTMRMNGEPLFTMTKGDVLRKWVFTHTAHHRGILSATLRLAGVGHGSIYEE